MNILLLTNEFPPHIYGGAGIHVQYLSREVAKLMPVHVRCFGDQNITTGNLSALGFSLDSNSYTCPKPLRSVFGALQRSLDFNTIDFKADLVHCHTWYVHWAGILAKVNYGIPLVITVHSLEPLRPWKREQLGGGYDFTCWLEKTAIEMADAVIAVSRETKNDIEHLFSVRPDRLHVIYNGIDLDEYKHVDSKAALKRFGINPVEPYVLFVGRITRQKGIVHLVNAIKYMDPGFQIVLCAGAPDTQEIAAEMKTAVSEMVDVKTKIELYSNAAVFVCPSIYEPFGIINLEAMACRTPVVAAAVGGIKEVVVHGETGYLVSIDQMQESPFEPVAPDRFSRDLAARINELMADPAKRKAFGEAGRRRAEEVFGWPAIAHQTAKLYESLTKKK